MTRKAIKSDLKRIDKVRDADIDAHQSHLAGRDGEPASAPGPIVSVLFLQLISFAIPNAAAAASPPITVVRVALRTGGAPVKRPFTYPKIASAATVAATEY